MQEFEKSHGNVATNLARTAALFQTCEIFNAFLAFLAIFKFLRILRFNRHITTINATFKIVRELV